MPYIHYECGGEIGLLSRKCRKCGKVWPLKVLFMYPYPEDMTYLVKEPPRWLKIVTRLSIVGAVLACILGIVAIVGFTPWTLGILVIPIIVAVIFIWTSKRSRG